MRRPQHTSRITVRFSRSRSKNYIKLLAKTIAKCSNCYIFCSCIIYPLVLKGGYLPKRPSLVYCRLPLRFRYSCCKIIRRPKRCGYGRLIIKGVVAHCESLYGQSILNIENQLCAHHRVIVVTVNELRVGDLEEDEFGSFVQARP